MAGSAGVADAGSCAHLGRPGGGRRFDAKGQPKESGGSRGTVAGSSRRHRGRQTACGPGTTNGPNREVHSVRSSHQHHPRNPERGRILSNRLGREPRHEGLCTSALSTPRLSASWDPDFLHGWTRRNQSPESSYLAGNPQAWSARKCRFRGRHCASSGSGVLSELLILQGQYCRGHSGDVPHQCAELF